MAVIPHLSRRGVTDVSISPLARNLILAIIVLLALILLGFGIFLILRSYRRRRFPSYNTSTAIAPLKPTTTTISSTHRNSHHRRHGAMATPPRLDLSATWSEKEMLFDAAAEKGPQTPDSPLPEIRITFPDEDEEGVKRAQKVMKVTVGEKGAVGLSPCEEAENKTLATPLGQKLETLDLDRIGGLKEKTHL